jgi:hypothetical protein
MTIVLQLSCSWGCLYLSFYIQGGEAIRKVTALVTI